MTARPVRGLLLGGLVAVRVLAAPHPGRAQALTLEDALAEAERANARLPVARLEADIAAAGVREAKGELWPSVEIGGHVHDGSPAEYASGDARLQLIGSVPVYDGGRLRAGVRIARAERGASLARYRQAEKDVDLDVRRRFAEIVALGEEVALREEGLRRLDRYVEFVRTRVRAGEPVADDLLRGKVRRDREAADLAAARRRLEDARLEMREVLGRAPDAPLELAPLPAPAPPPAAADSAWTGAPEVVEAEAVLARARGESDRIRAGRKPRVDLEANGGWEPVLGSSFDAPLNTGRDAGVEVTLAFDLPLWDRTYPARRAAARLEVDRAGRELDLARRRARLEWNTARADLRHLWEEVGLRSGYVPPALDAYLRADSRYRGGDAPALDVLDAFDEWVQAGIEAAQATLDYRVALARGIRWGTP